MRDKRLENIISTNIILVNIFYFWYLSGQSYNHLLSGLRRFYHEITHFSLSFYFNINIGVRRSKDSGTSFHST